MQPTKFDHDPMTTCDDETDRLLFDDSAGFGVASERRAALGCFRHSKDAVLLNVKGSSRTILFVVPIAILIPAFLMLMSSCKGEKSPKDLPQTNTEIERAVEVDEFDTYILES